MSRLALTTAAVLLAGLILVSPALAAWTWPLRGELITAYSNGADPYAGGRHRGIDIAGEPGAPVVAAEAGTVRFAGTVGSSGLTVSVRTADGAYDTSYLHLSSVAVGAGEAVAAGARIGAVGTTGVRSVQRPHLHFGVREAGSRHSYHDPLALLPPGPVPGDLPRAAPLPAPAPVPAVPAPVRVPSARPGPAPRRVPSPAPRSAPAPDLAPRPVPVPVPSPRLAPRPVPAPGGVEVRRPAPSPRPVSAPAPRPAGERLRAEEPAHAAAPRPLHAPDTGRTVASGPQQASDAPARVVPDARPSRPPGAQPAGAGPDLGLVLACLGLLAAAALLGLSEGGRAATRRTSKEAAGLLRPLLGRR